VGRYRATAWESRTGSSIIWEISQEGPDLVADTAELGDSLFCGTLHGSGVFKIVMDRKRLAGKNQTFPWRGHKQ
jgi:hypothetical protein